MLVCINIISWKGVNYY